MAEHLLERPLAPPSHHPDIQGGTARAAVFGVSDGLVTNVSLVLGVAGAGTGAGVVRLAGLASLLAGAFSMAAGEYVSMRAQAELLQGQIERERAQLEEDPHGELEELEQLYLSRGVPREIAGPLAAEMMRMPELALETHAREELGVDPNELGSPVGAALSSFATFVLGAAIPLVPWFFVAGFTAIVISLTLAAVGAIAIGVTLARFTGRPWLHSAARQLAVAMLAAGVTYGVGTLLGVSVA
jgi:VIT1/CCC1 family predicted Fe2+/Mn2+ transporter